MPSTYEKPFDVNGTHILVADMKSPLAVVITHPWGPLGGNMHNNVVKAVALYFQKQGVTTMRINFKGFGISRGYGEMKEVVDCCNFLLYGQHISHNNENKVEQTTTQIAEKPMYRKSNINGQETEENSFQRHYAPTSILLVGYSYGALIAGSASASIYNCIGYVLISTPLDVKHWLLMFNSRYHITRARNRQNFPRLMIQGSKDQFSSESSFHSLVDSFPSDTIGAVIKDMNHFFQGREATVTKAIEKWILEAYPVELKGDLKNLKIASLRLPDDNKLVGSPTDDNFSMQSLLYKDDNGGDVLSINNPVEDEKPPGIMGQLYECAFVDTPCRSGAI